MRCAPLCPSAVDARGADRQPAITERADEAARIIQRRGFRLRRDNPRTMPQEPAMPDLTLLFKWLTVVGDRDVEARMSLYAPDAVWDMSEGGVGVVEGREEIRAFFEEWLAAYVEYEQEVEEIQDLGNGVAFGVFLQRGRPAGSRGWVEFRDARVLLWADGLIERVNLFLDIDEARAAAERLAEERG